jgi:hypothetical protein
MALIFEAAWHPDPLLIWQDWDEIGMGTSRSLMDGRGENQALVAAY